MLGLPMHAQTTSWTADNGNGTFTNPLFYDEFSDPDILRVGDDYYLAGTTMHTVPGLVILHSRDLVNWRMSAIASTASILTTMHSHSRTTRRSTDKASGLLPSDMPMDSFMYSPTSTARDSNALRARTSGDHGNTTTWKDAYTTSACCLTMTAKYMPYMAMARSTAQSLSQT